MNQQPNSKFIGRFVSMRNGIPVRSSHGNIRGAKPKDYRLVPNKSGRYTIGGRNMSADELAAALGVTLEALRASAELPPANDAGVKLPRVEKPKPEPVELPETVLTLSRCAGGHKNTDMTDWPVTWNELRDAVSKALVGDKDGAYYLRGQCASPRSNTGMAGAALLIIDGDKSYDRETGEIVDKCVPPEEAHEALRELGYPHVLHTSYSHDPAGGKNKWRCLIECEMHTVAELNAMANWIIERLNGCGVPIVFVKEMVSMAQPWYFPRVRSEDAPFSVYSYDLEEGESHPLTRDLVETVTREWVQKASVIDPSSERGSVRDENTPIGQFMKKFDTADFIAGMLEEYGGCEVVGTDVVNRKLAYRLLPPGSTSGAAGVHVYRGRGDGTWLLFSHNDSFQLPEGKSKALDAFGVFQWLKHDNDQTAALADAKRMLGEAAGELDYDAAEAMIDEALSIESERDRVSRLKKIAQEVTASSLIDASDTGKLLKRIAKHAGISVQDLRKDLKAVKRKARTSESGGFMRNEDTGQILCNAVNHSIAVGTPSLISAEIAFNTFTGRIVTRQMGCSEWVNFEDHQYHELKCCLDRSNFERTTTDFVRGAVHSVARANSFDSLKDWVEGLAWDGKARVGAFCHAILGCEDSDYSTSVGEYMWTALAARALCENPAGVKADMVPILLGDQGLKKSTMLRSMAPAPDMFVELDLSDGLKELVRLMRGRCIYELGELVGLSKRSTGHLKYLFSKQADAHRENYAEFAADVVRRGLMVGTGNEEEILEDHTGNRRYLPIMVGTYKSADVFKPLDAQTREQLWAEGLQIYRSSGILFERAENLAKDVHQHHINYDIWAGTIASWLDEEWFDDLVGITRTNADRPDITTELLATWVLQIDIDRQDKIVKNRIRNVMCALGYKKAKGVMRGAHGPKGDAWRKA